MSEQAPNLPIDPNGTAIERAERGLDAYELSTEHIFDENRAQRMAEERQAGLELDNYLDNRLEINEDGQAIDPKGQIVDPDKYHNEQREIWYEATQKPYEEMTASNLFNRLAFAEIQKDETTLRNISDILPEKMAADDVSLSFIAKSLAIAEFNSLDVAEKIANEALNAKLTKIHNRQLTSRDTSYRIRSKYGGSEDVSNLQNNAQAYDQLRTRILKLKDEYLSQLDRTKKNPKPQNPDSNPDPEPVVVTLKKPAGSQNPTPHDPNDGPEDVPRLKKSARLRAHLGGIASKILFKPENHVKGHGKKPRFAATGADKTAGHLLQKELEANLQRRYTVTGSQPRDDGNVVAGLDSHNEEQPTAEIIQLDTTSGGFEINDAVEARLGGTPDGLLVEGIVEWILEGQNMTVQNILDPIQDFTFSMPPQHVIDEINENLKSKKPKA